MADMTRVRAGDIVRAEVLGDSYFAEVLTAPQKVRPRVYEIDVRPLFAAPHRRGERYTRLRARAVKTIYRRLR